jgi:hypothetical protein
MSTTTAGDLFIYFKNHLKIISLFNIMESKPECFEYHLYNQYSPFQRTGSTNFHIVSNYSPADLYTELYVDELPTELKNQIGKLTIGEKWYADRIPWDQWGAIIKNKSFEVNVYKWRYHLHMKTNLTTNAIIDSIVELLYSNFYTFTNSSGKPEIHPVSYLHPSILMKIEEKKKLLIQPKIHQYFMRIKPLV